MKINKKINKSNFLIKLKLAEIRLQNFYLNLNNLNDFTIRLKRALKVIYKYHINKKKIMFVGIKENINPYFKKLLKKSKHIFLPDSFWNYGILTNPSVSLYNLKKTSKFFANRTFLKLKKINLVVILESSFKKIIFNECNKVRLPIIFLSENFPTLNSIKNYNFPNNCLFSRKKVGNSFFYSMLFALLKKREIFMFKRKKKN